jgi:hypothetical protein
MSGTVTPFGPDFHSMFATPEETERSGTEKEFVSHAFSKEGQFAQGGLFTGPITVDYDRAGHGNTAFSRPLRSHKSYPFPAQQYFKTKNINIKRGVMFRN